MYYIDCANRRVYQDEKEIMLEQDITNRHWSLIEKIVEKEDLVTWDELEKEMQMVGGTRLIQEYIREFLKAIGNYQNKAERIFTIKYKTGLRINRDLVTTERTFELPKKNWDSTRCRPVTYRELRELGYSNRRIAEALVANDVALYGDAETYEEVIHSENEGTPAQWARFLNSTPESFQYLINSRNEIVGNFSYISLTPEQTREALTGRLREGTLSPAETRHLRSKGVHQMFLLNLAIIDEYNTMENCCTLYQMFWRQILNYAEIDVFFDQIVSNVFRPEEESLLKSWGFTFVTEHQLSGNIFQLVMMPFQELLYNAFKEDDQMCDTIARIRYLYEEKYREVMRESDNEHKGDD